MFDRNEFPNIQPRGETIGSELPQYPAEWTTEQRLAAYWYGINHPTRFPNSTKGWEPLLIHANNEAARCADRRFRLGLP